MDKHLKVLLSIRFVLVMVTVSSYAQNTLKDSYPVPPKSDNLLFYLQRTCNKSAVTYELNTLPDGNLDQQEPVVPYWLEYAEKGGKEKLTYIQKKLAYGVNTVLTNKEKGYYILTFIVYKKRTFYLQKRYTDNKYRVFTLINGKICELQSIFINTIDRTIGFPEVKSVEIFGLDSQTGEKVYEKFIP